MAGFDKQTLFSERGCLMTDYEELKEYCRNGDGWRISTRKEGSQFYAAVTVGEVTLTTELLFTPQDAHDAACAMLADWMSDKC